MAPLDIATCLNASIAFLALLLRGNMLKPEARGWADSRPASVSIVTLSIAFAAEAIDVYQRGGATPREAAVVTAVALSSVIMLVHLWRQRNSPAKPACEARP